MALTEDVANTMRVLEMLAPEPEGLRVTQIAEALGVNKAIAHRLLGALVASGYVVQESRTSAYFATHRLGAIGLRQLSAAGVDDWSKRALDALATKSEELVRLAVATGDTLQWVAKAQGANSTLRLDPVMGQDAVPHATASGKAWLSTLTQDRVRDILKREATAPQTSRSPLDIEALSSELAEARQRGYATTFEEMDLGINAVAAPIYGAGQNEAATGTISIAGPSVRLTRSRLVDLSTPLREAADDIAASWPSFTYLTLNSEIMA
ncbi:IclR family transcriptional regulator [Rothia halotolerans]|uniref:IclR family transcriptional regulator n=1 Tax=Rothia halotolerans TaxID=405770 RepID=UPI00101CC93D|nr:IclR family transcriptional regulator [Rothia halotolerans]